MSNIIELFISRNIITRKDFDKILNVKTDNEPVHQLAIRSGLVSEEDYLKVLQEEFHYHILENFPEDFDPEKFEGLSPLFMDEHNFIPLEVNDGELKIVVNDPFDYLIFDILKKFYPRKRFLVYLSRKEKIKHWINNFFHQEAERDQQKA